MSNSGTVQRPDAKRPELEAQLGRLERVDPEAAAVIRETRTAFAFYDEELAAAYLAEAREAVVRGYTSLLRYRMQQADDAMAFSQSAARWQTGRPTSAPLDKLGHAVRDQLDAARDQLTAARQEAADVFRRHGGDILPAVDAKVEEVERVKHKMLHNWPWSDRPFPPFDRAKVEAARARFAAGDPGIPVRDLIRQLEAELLTESGGTPEG